MVAKKGPNTLDSIDAKIEEGGKETGVGILHVIAGTCDALGNTLKLGLHAVGAGISKVKEKLSNEDDKKLLNSRKVITESHIQRLKNSGKNALKGVGTALSGSRETIKGTGKVTYHSVKKTIHHNTPNQSKPTTKKTKKK